MKIDAHRLEEIANEIKAELKSYMQKQFDDVREDIAKLWNLKEVLNSKEYIDNQEVCFMLGISKRTLARYRQRGVIPSYVIGRKTVYKPNEIYDYVRDHVRVPSPTTKRKK